MAKSRLTSLFNFAAKDKEKEEPEKLEPTYEMQGEIAEGVRQGIAAKRAAQTWQKHKIPEPSKLKNPPIQEFNNTSKITYQMQENHTKGVQIGMNTYDAAKPWRGEVSTIENKTLKGDFSKVGKASQQTTSEAEISKVTTNNQKIKETIKGQASKDISNDNSLDFEL